jgi:hypothetical protein
MEWVAEIGGIKRRWEAKVLEQVPDRRVSWAATEGATNAGEVTFEDVGGGQTSLHLSLEYEPEGLVEKVGDKLNIVENQAEGDLDRFKAFIESEGYASGAWRGSINEGTRVPGTVGSPGVEDAAGTRGDSGKAGVSGKAVAAGLGAAAAAAGIAAVAASSKSSPTSTPSVTTTTAATTAPSPAAVAPPVEAPAIGDVPASTGTGEAVPGRVVSYEEVEDITEANEHGGQRGSV